MQVSLLNYVYVFMIFTFLQSHLTQFLFYGSISWTEFYYRIGVTLSENDITQHDGFYTETVTSNTTLLEMIQSHINNGISNAFPSAPTAAFINYCI